MKQRLFVTISTAAIVAAALAPANADAQTRDAGLAAPSAPAARPMTTPSTTSSANVDATSRKDYRLSPGDKLRIEVYKDAQLSQSVQIRPDGKITLPLLGDLEAQGATPLELRDRLANSLRQFLTNPVVSVMVVEATPPTAYVVGEVNHPGPIELKNEMTVLQALAIAGWLKDFAVTKNIRILRPDITGTKTIPFNYKDALNGIGRTVYLQPGDTVVVPD